MMVSMDVCRQAVYRDGARWFCPSCESFYETESDGIEEDSDVSSGIVCVSCDHKLARASMAYAYE